MRKILVSLALAVGLVGIFAQAWRANPAESGKRYGLVVVQTRVVTEASQGLAKDTVILGPEDWLTPNRRVLRIYKGIGQVEPGIVQAAHRLQTKPGLLVMDVIEGTSGARAGLQPGDLLLGSIPSEDARPKELFLSRMVDGSLVHLEEALMFRPVAATCTVAVLPGQSGCILNKFCALGCYPCGYAASNWIGCIVQACTGQEECKTQGACCITCYYI